MSNYLTNEERLLREKRGRLVYSISSLLFIALSCYLIWALRELILPAVIGMVMAYICLPILGLLKDKGFSHFWAVISLSGLFCLILFSTINLSGDLVPDQKTELELQVRIRYKLDEKFSRIMGLSDDKKGGNWFYGLFGRELEPLKTKVDEALRLSKEDRQLFKKFFQNPDELATSPVPERYWNYHQANLERDREKEKQARNTRRGAKTKTFPEPGPGAGQSQESSLLVIIFDAISLWLITPLIFLILLFDDGKLKKTFVHAVPNQYFEMTLTILDNINEALGRYLRGTFLECSLVGLSFTVFLSLIGLDMQWAATIGIIAGLANAIPFLGPAIGLLVGVVYAIMAEDVSSVLPFINNDNLLVAIVVVVAIVQLADNAIFQPYVLGNAVDLHPLAVILGVMGGAVIFGFAGMLFAVPAIMVVKVILSTLFRQFRAYYIV
ncbi:MAG: AI-2E family transporter [Thermodesulfobacteriota bacterium]